MKSIFLMFCTWKHQIPPVWLSLHVAPLFYTYHTVFRGQDTWHSRKHARISSRFIWPSMYRHTAPHSPHQKISAVRWQDPDPGRQWLCFLRLSLFITSLCKFVSETGRDWDKWLPFLLFAYREVPQASTGFSPFELLYGWRVQGLLDLLRKSSETASPEETTKSEKGIAQYVLEMRDHLESYLEKAQ